MTAGTNDEIKGIKEEAEESSPEMRKGDRKFNFLKRKSRAMGQ